MTDKSTDEWAEPRPNKRTKCSECIFHCDDSSNEQLIKPGSWSFWKVLLNAAQIRNYATLLEISEELSIGQIPDIQYHKRCRSIFTLKKTLDTFPKIHDERAFNRSQRTPGQSALLPNYCIFCEKEFIYRNKRKEYLERCEEKKSGKSVAQETIYEITKILNDDKIIKLCHNYDFLSAEAKYHRSCYRNYTRPEKSNSDNNENTYTVLEAAAYSHLFQYIRNEVLQNGNVIALTELTSVLEEFFKLKGAEIQVTTKKKIRCKIELTFSNELEILQNNKGKALVLPKILSREQLASEVIVLKKQLKLVNSEWDKNLEIVNNAAHIIRSDAKLRKPKWPPTFTELHSSNESLPPYLNSFLRYLIHDGKNTVLTTKMSSLGQDILYSVNNGRLLTQKHILLSFTVKSLTGNVELIKILNRLGHGISYSKLTEIDTAFALQKLSRPTFLIPEDIYPNMQVSLVYDNIDRLEETLSGGGTTHRVNGIAIQKKLIGPHQDKALDRTIEISKRRSIDVEIRTCSI